MVARSVAGFAGGLACLLLIASSAPAQGKGGGDAIKKLEADLQKLRDQIKQTEADLAKAKQQGRTPDFGGWGWSRGGAGWSRGGGGFGGGFGGYRGGRPGFMKDDAKLDPATIKERYEHYKKLYEALPKGSPPGKGRGFERPGGPGAGSASLESRVERMMRELEDLRKELKKKGS